VAEEAADPAAIVAEPAMRGRATTGERKSAPELKITGKSRAGGQTSGEGVRAWVLLEGHGGKPNKQ